MTGIGGMVLRAEQKARWLPGGQTEGLSLSTHHNPPPPLHKGAFPAPYNNFTNYAVSTCKQSGIILADLLFVNAKRAMTDSVIALLG